jgi:uncharacterized protein YbjT (DUF2867 family)
MSATAGARALPADDPTRQPTVLLAGASGLVGRALLAQLLDDDQATVHALLRRNVPDLITSRRLVRHVIDFAKPPRLPRADVLYVALGTTIKVAGSQAAFRAVDFDAVVNVARAAREAGVERCAVVSALGASAGSSVFYNRVKGEMEAALRGMGFSRLVIARPSLLTGGRERLGQGARFGERLSLAVLQPLGALVPASVRPIEASVVARAMRMALRGDGERVQVVESAALQQLGHRSA